MSFILSEAASSRRRAICDDAERLPANLCCSVPYDVAAQQKVHHLESAHNRQHHNKLA